MRKLFLPIVAAVIALTGCSEDFEVSAPYKDVTVVYGIFNKQDTAHYIRIQKAFLDENKGAVDMAKESDSSFHSQLEVTLREISPSGSVIDNMLLSRVDLNNEGFPKQPGAFFTTPNWGYKFKKTLNHSYRYRVVMLNKATGDADSAETAIINTDTFSSPGNFYIADFSTNIYTINLTNVLPTAKIVLPIGVPSNARVFEGWMRFHWVDKNAATNEQTDRSAEFKFADVAANPGRTTVTLEVGVPEIYSFLIGAMGPAPAGIARFMDSTTVYVYAGSEELYTYQQIKLGQSGGLTGDQIKPNYTNVQGEDVLGLLGSRAMRIKYDVPFTALTIDSFRNRSIMVPLNIQGTADH